MEDLPAITRETQILLINNFIKILLVLSLLGIFFGGNIVLDDVIIFIIELGE